MTFQRFHVSFQYSYTDGIQNHFPMIKFLPGNGIDSSSLKSYRENEIVEVLFHTTPEPPSVVVILVSRVL